MNKYKSSKLPERYAAKLVFQLRFDGEDKKKHYRMVEERIIVARSNSADNAYKKFLEKGELLQGSFKNDDGVVCYIEFIGIMDLMHLGIESDDDEVWYVMRKMKMPMERRDKILPEKKNLSAFRYEAEKARS